MVDWPRAEAPVPVVAPAAVVEGAAVVVAAPAAVVVAAGWVEGVVAAGLLNKFKPEAAGWVVAGAGAEVVAAVPGVDSALVLAPPKPPNKPPAGAVAGVVDGAAEDVAPPRDGKKDFCGVAVDVAGAPEDG